MRMSQDDHTSDLPADRSAAVEATGTPAADQPHVATPAASAPPPSSAARGHADRSAFAGARRPAKTAAGLGTVLAMVLALVALALAAYIGWRQYNAQAGVNAAVLSSVGLTTRVGDLDRNVSTLTGERALIRQQLADAEQVNHSLRDELLGQSAQLRNLNDAVAKLSEKTLSGHDTLLLDDTESLLRMGQQRYTLFHDAHGAASAYTLAEQALSAVNDVAFNGLRQSIRAEHDALLASQPQTQMTALANLQQLRDVLPALPLKPADLPAQAPAAGAWERVRRALTGVISVQRDNGAPLAVADARFARELTALDLAQAQAAVLGWDANAAAAALKRADAAIAARFDPADAGVQQARSKLAAMAGTLQPTPPATLGGALNELRNLRSVHALTPAVTPAPAASAALTGGDPLATPARAASTGTRP